jgi:excinuclease ABC subunit A
VDIVVDRLVMDDKSRHPGRRFGRNGSPPGNGLVHVYFPDGGDDRVYSEKYYCHEHEIGFDEIEPKMFSFNAPYGACPRCSGLGEILEFDEHALVDWNLSISEGALKSHPTSQNSGCRSSRARQKGEILTRHALQGLPGERTGRMILYGTGETIEIEIRERPDAGQTCAGNTKHHPEPSAAVLRDGLRGNEGMVRALHGAPRSAPNATATV